MLFHVVIGGVPPHLPQASVPLRSRILEQQQRVQHVLLQEASPRQETEKDQHPPDINRRDIRRQLAAPQPVQPHSRHGENAGLFQKHHEDHLRRVPHDGDVLRLLQPRAVRLAQRKLLERVQGYHVHRVQGRSGERQRKKNFDQEVVEEDAGARDARPGGGGDGLPAGLHHRYDQLHQLAPEEVH